MEDWLADCQIRQHSPRTNDLRRVLLGRLRWFLEHRQAAYCDALELRAFFAYLSTGHKDETGRWGKVGNQQYTGALRPTTVSTYHRCLRSFFTWLVAEEYLQATPMERIATPVVREDQVQPFTQQQIRDLLHAASRSRHSRRDEAIVRLLLDTGVRVTELADLRMREVDLMEGQAHVLGKGNKYRTVGFGRHASRALRAYLRDEVRTPDEAVFMSERGENTGAKLTRWGVRQIIERLGRAAGIQSTRCSPHTFRHTFAVEFLRAGGNVFTLKQLLGHTGLAVTNRYVALAQADIQSQCRQFCPGDRLR